MDTDYPIDLRAVFEVIDSAEVITFGFITITGADNHALWERIC